MNRCHLKALALCTGVLLLNASTRAAEPSHEHAGHHHGHHEHHAMSLDRDGMSMNANTDRLPRDCPQVSEDIDIQVHVGRAYAATGRAYGFDQHQWQVPGCARLKVTLVNDDEIRHQWMVHGLPRYLYPQGMFHLEAHGGTRRSASFIVPSDDQTYLVHCDMAQHMEKGLKAQLVVGSGDGDLPSLPGISGPRRPDRYDTQ